MFYILMLLCCACADSVEGSTPVIREKQVLINVQETPKIEKLQFFKEEVQKIRLTNESRIRFIDEQAKSH
jgi:hypothetical protein